MKINKKRAIDNFISLAKINSPSFFEDKLADYLKKIFTSLSYEVIEDSKSKNKIKNSKVGNLIIKIDGKGTLKEKEPVIFSAHMDTVAKVSDKIIPKITEDGKYVLSDGKTILGADNKGGIAQIIELLHMIKESDLDHRPFEVVLTICEEVGLFGSFNVDSSLLQSKVAYVLDGEGSPGEVIVGGPEYYVVSGEVIGKSSHAGVAPEKGISSIQVISEAITKMPLLKVDDETSVNIGKVICDYPTNVVPEKTFFELEIRSLNKNIAKETLDNIVDILNNTSSKYKAQIKIDIKKELSAYCYDENNEFLNNYKKICTKYNVNYKPIVVKGGTDSSGFIKNGIDAICLSSAGLRPHAFDEALDIEDFYKNIQQLVWLITEDL